MTDPLHPYPGNMKQHNVKSAVEQAAERYPLAIPGVMDDFNRRFAKAGYAECLTERAMPAEQRETELKAWKESAMSVMAEWDKVYEALGRPGFIGSSMAASSLDEVKQLRQTIQALVDALEWSSDLAAAWSYAGTRAQEDVHPDHMVGLDRNRAALSLASEKHGITPTAK